MSNQSDRRVVTRACGLALALAMAGGARAQVAAVTSFSSIPGATYHAIDNTQPCIAHYREDFVVIANGTPVTVSYYDEASADHRYLIDCAEWAGFHWNSYRVPNDPLVNPGDFEGDGTRAAGPDLVLNFSAALTGFGTTSILPLFNAGDADTIIAYDAPNGSGTVLGTATTQPAEYFELSLDFVGFVSATPAIRSIRYVNAGKGFTIDAIALATPTPFVACPADVDDGTGAGVPDHGIDINDLLYFLAQYEAGAPRADLDDGSGAGTPDGGVDINDLLFFLAHYEAGC